MQDYPRDPDRWPPWIASTPDPRSGTYIDLAHPDDVGRRIVDPAGRWVVNALFGHDLERGVVLRGRLRGLWCRGAQPELLAQEALARFLAEPLPLTT